MEVGRSMIETSENPSVCLRADAWTFWRRVVINKASWLSTSENKIKMSPWEGTLDRSQWFSILRCTGESPGVFMWFWYLGPFITDSDLTGFGSTQAPAYWAAQVIPVNVQLGWTALWMRCGLSWSGVWLVAQVLLMNCSYKDEYTKKTFQ